MVSAIRVFAQRTERLRDFAAGCALFAGNLLILAPYLVTDLSGQPWNNDYSYYAMIRMFREHPWSWTPLWYGGMPFRNLYPPLFHALAACIPGLSVGRAFHLLSGISYALVPVACYVLGLALFKSRLPAILAAAAYGFFPSPVYLFAMWAHLARDLHYPPS